MKITKTEVAELIKIREKNTFRNHLKNVVTRDFSVKGDVLRNEIIIWQQGFWNRTTYPVFRFAFNEDQHLIHIASRQNPGGRLFNILLVLPFVWVIPFQLYTGKSLWYDWKGFLLLVLLVVGGAFFINKVYAFEKQNQLESFYEALDIDNDHRSGKIRKEGSWKSMITRILLYPICLGLLFVAVFILFPQRNIFQGIGAIGISVTYLYTDIKIWRQKKVTARKGKK